MACAFAPQNSGTPKISEKNTAQELSGYHPAVRDVTANPENEKTDDVTLKTALSIIPSPDLYCLAPDYNPRNIQKIVEEGILLAGGAVAILLQVADPGVGAGANKNDICLLHGFWDTERASNHY
jgi:hypothetical protein